MRRYCYVSGLRTGAEALRRLCAQGWAPALVVTNASGATSTRALDLPTLETDDLDSAATRQALQDHEIDLLVVADWPAAISAATLESVPLGGVGLHPTPLPVGRGHDPIPWTILLDMAASAVSLIRLAPGMQVGDLLARQWFPVPEDVTATDLWSTISRLQADLLTAHLPAVVDGAAQAVPLDGHGSFWPPLEADAAMVRWSDPGAQIVRVARAFADPFQGAYGFVDGTKLTLVECEVGIRTFPATPPGVVAEGGGVGAGDGTTVALSSVRVDDGPTVPAAHLTTDLLKPGRMFDAT